MGAGRPPRLMRSTSGPQHPQRTVQYASGVRPLVLHIIHRNSLRALKDRNGLALNLTRPEGNPGRLLRGRRRYVTVEWGYCASIVKEHCRFTGPFESGRNRPGYIRPDKILSPFHSPVKVTTRGDNQE